MYFSSVRPVDQLLRQLTNEGLLYCARPELVYESGESDRFETDAENLDESWIFLMVNTFS